MTTLTCCYLTESEVGKAFEGCCWAFLKWMDGFRCVMRAELQVKLVGP